MVAVFAIFASKQAFGFEGLELLFDYRIDGAELLNETFAGKAIAIA